MSTRTRSRAGTASAAVVAAVLALGGLQGSTAGAQTVGAGGVGVGGTGDDGGKGDVPTSPTSPTTCHGTQPKGSLAGQGYPDDTPLERTVVYVDGLSTGRHSDIFTGLVLDEEASSVDIYRIPSAPFDKAVCDSAEKGVTVRLHDRDINEKDLTALADRVSEDMTRWDGTFNMREVGLDGTGHIHIGVDDPSTAEPILRKAYGERTAKYLRVEYTPQAHLD